MAVDRTPDGDADNVDESAASQRRLPRDDPGAEGVPSRADSRAGAAAANDATRGQADAKHDDDRAEVTPQPSADHDAGETVPEATKPNEEEGSEQAPDTAAGEDKPRDLAFRVGGKPLREYIDPIGAETDQRRPEGHKEPSERTMRDKDAPWTDGVDTLDDLPTGEKLGEPDEDERSKIDRFRAKAYENIGDVKSNVEKAAKTIDGVFGPRPTGHAEVKTDSGPSTVDAHHSSVDLGSAVSTFLVVGIVGAEVVRKVHEKMKGKDQ